MALIDLDCDEAILVNPDHSQYPASAGKIVIAITALRAVQDALLEFEGEVQEDIEVILSKSLDANSDRLNDKVTTEQIAAVLERAGTSEASELEHSWRYAHLTPLDLARVWVSLVRGEQLNEELTAYLLDLATRPELGDAFWPFPRDFGVEGYVYGQKAGYWTSGGSGRLPRLRRLRAPRGRLQRGLRLRVPDPGGLAGPARLLAAPRLPAGPGLHRGGVGGGCAGGGVAATRGHPRVSPHPVLSPERETPRGLTGQAASSSRSCRCGHAPSSRRPGGRFGRG